MSEIILLDEVLNYIDDAILDSENREVYISNIKIIHKYFIDREYLPSNKKTGLLNQCNKLIVKFIDHDNTDIKNLWYDFRNFIIDEIITS